MMINYILGLSLVGLMKFFAIFLSSLEGGIDVIIHSRKDSMALAVDFIKDPSKECVHILSFCGWLLVCAFFMCDGENPSLGLLLFHNVVWISLSSFW